MIVAFLLAVSLVPATALSAFADEADQPEASSIEQDATELEADEPEADELDEVSSETPEALEEVALEAPGIAPLSNSIEPMAGPAEIVLQVQEGGPLTIANQWNTAILVSVGSAAAVTVSSSSTYTTPVLTTNQTITITESNEGAFRSWSSFSEPLVKGLACSIIAMPPMSAFTTDTAGTTAGDSFFYGFNMRGSITSLPAGSFNTSSITTAGWGFFMYFNALSSSLTSLPAGSFDTSKITTAPHFFFYYFNYQGGLTSLPVGSFDNSRITSVGNYFFVQFDGEGSLTYLPISFKLPNTPTSVGSDYCTDMFNGSDLTKGDELVELYFGRAASNAFAGTEIAPASPAAGARVKVNGPLRPPAEIVLQAQATGSLTINNQWNSAILVTVGSSAPVSVARGTYSSFSVLTNQTISVKESIGSTTFRSWFALTTPMVEGVRCAITSMPPMSAFTTDVAGTTAGDNFFMSFNEQGLLASLPAGSFDTSSITTVGSHFFARFNYGANLTSLPTGSFDTSKITIAEGSFFSNFNTGGALSSLPTGSFDISKITTAKNYFFMEFNYNGALTTLPTGSFNALKIASVGSSFFFGFNRDGALAYLPESFKLPNSLNSAGINYCTDMFNGSALTRGNELVQLYFARDATNTFTGTDITPASPASGSTVKVTGPPMPSAEIVLQA